MIGKSFLRESKAKSLIAISLVFASCAVGLTGEVDPTIPSRQIFERLGLGHALPNREGNSPPAIDLVPLDRLRLKAIVLRDRDHGTALISFDNTETYVVTLRRESTPSKPVRINIRGRQIAVETFTDTSITIRLLDTHEQMIIN